MDINAIWKQCKLDWANRKSPSIDAATIKNIFSYSSISTEAVELVKSSKWAHKTLAEATKRFPQMVTQAYGPRVWFSLWGKAGIDQLMISGRTEVDSVAERAEVIGGIAGFAVRQMGRAWVRNHLRRWWREANFLEEEKESLLSSLAYRNVLNWPFLNELGIDAIQTVQRLLRRGRLEPKQIDGVDFATLRNIQGRKAGNPLGPRIGRLLHPVMIPLDIRDSCLYFDELTGNMDTGWLYSVANQALLDHASKVFGKFDPFDRKEIIMAIKEFAKQRPYNFNEVGDPTLQFPLIRFLHLRLLLESPSLGTALYNPEQFLVPEVLTYALGRDSVSYVPELRVLREMDRRWRARWAESAGEAMSVLFLESTIALDLTTLARIPETSDGPTPDFLARTSNDEHIVFESKGATVWKVHLKQRKAALRQLEKNGSEKASKGAWVGTGRAFALALFAAQQGDPKSSLLHVDDPPFPFDKLFIKGWEEQARRTHFCAVLEAAQLFDIAENLQKRRDSEVLPENVQYFSIEGASKQKRELPRFAGTFLPTQEIARRMRHPDMTTVKSLRIFVGVDDQILTRLRRNELPKVRSQTESYDEEPLIAIPPWGLLPGGEPNQPPRGIYSLLADGSFLAVELQ